MSSRGAEVESGEGVAVLRLRGCEMVEVEMDLCSLSRAGLYWICPPPG